MSKNKILQPKIRFKEFSGENAEAWEQRKLGAFLHLPKKIELAIKDTDELMTVKLNLGGIIKGSLRDTLSLGSTKYYQRKAGQLIYGKQNFFNGSIAIIPKAFDGLATSGDVPSFEISNINKEFLYHNIARKNYWRKAEALASGTGSKRIHEQTFLQMKIYVSVNPKEQILISKLINSLNNTITLHQRKLETLESLKKTLLSKMFPKNGKAVPELRFSGFTDNWEQRKLGEITSITMGQSPNSLNYTNNPNDHILVQGNADILNGKVNPRVWTKEVTKTAEPGDIILTVRAPVGDVAVTEYNVVLGRGVASIKGNGFIFQLLKTFKLNGYWLKLSTGSTFDSINSLDLKNTTAYIPNKTEQDAISFLLSIVDTTITLHQRKIEQYQELKKTLLSKMFI
ncbi:restriction endonuclease subunit S [Globicatella sanguinis]